ncbi:MAG: 4Fe-4S binding protein [Mariprofundales bacterium]|nr:4Fe-4S binding protein [Mariprofundales bacterium]
MIHPLPSSWCLLILVSVAMVAGWALLSPPPVQQHGEISKPLILNWIGSYFRMRWPLLVLKLVMVGLFLLVIFSGLYGTPIPQRNLATELTWNIWWAGLIVSVFFLGSAWCAVCPWQTIASWLLRLSAMGSGKGGSGSLNLPVPALLRGVWPALLLLVVLTWLELGYGITANPYVTALLAMLMLMMTTASHALFERKAFCRHFCPVGRTIGVYAQLAPVALRHIDAEVCNHCTTLECYHGSSEVEPCPTGLVMKNLQENTYCISCGNCVRSCPESNIAWQLRPMSQEACRNARPRLDEAWFMLVLLALAALHGMTMLPIWETWVRQLGGWLGGGSQLLWGFSAGLFFTVLFTVIIYAGLVAFTAALNRGGVGFGRLFVGMAFITLPLAFTYHIAHNLSHLFRENNIHQWLLHPFGLEHGNPLAVRHMAMVSADTNTVLFALQAGLIVVGFWLSMMILRYRGEKLRIDRGWRLAPLCLFALLVTSLHVWLLSQPMMMRF